MPPIPNFNPRSSCEERPSCPASTACAMRHFNPRSSCEERRFSSLLDVAFTQFQSTLLMRGATRSTAYPSNTDVFQSTLLMRGATAIRRTRGATISFQSTLLMRGATRFQHLMIHGWIISIHAPHARSDTSTAGIPVYLSDGFTI